MIADALAIVAAVSIIDTYYVGGPAVSCGYCGLSILSTVE